MQLQLKLSAFLPAGDLLIFSSLLFYTSFFCILDRHTHPYSRSTKNVIIFTVIFTIIKNTIIIIIPVASTMVTSPQRGEGGYRH